MVSELNGDHFSITESPEELVRIIARVLQKMVGKARGSLPKEFKEFSEKLVKVVEEAIKLQSYVTSEYPFFSSHKNSKAKSSAVVLKILPRPVIQSKL